MLGESVILDGLPDPILLIDRRGYVRYLNRACESAFGLSTGSVEGRTLTQILGPQIDEGLLAALTPDPSREIGPASLPYVRFGQSYWDVRVMPGGDGAAVVYCSPSAGAVARWRELVADAADAIYAVDDEERIVAWNRGAEELFGYAAEEIVGQPLTRLIPVDLIDDREPERLGKVLLELGAVRDYHTRRLTRDGREVDVSLTRTLTRNGARNGVGLASSTIVRELSQRRAVERQMIESEKMVTLGQLAASVAQEIGAPLTSIGIVIESLRRRSRGNGDVERQLETAAQELKRIARLTHGLVELAKPGELHLTRVNLCDVVERVLELLEASFKRAGMVVEAECNSPLPLLAADAGQLQQVLLNLLMNAQRALEPERGGRVTIHAERARGLPVVGRPMRDVVKLEISDDGPGVDPADLPYIFAPFFSRSGGSGLGLALAKQIVHAHGGTIEARSTPGEGATFTILLPVDSDA